MCYINRYLLISRVPLRKRVGLIHSFSFLCHLRFESIFTDFWYKWDKLGVCVKYILTVNNFSRQYQGFTIYHPGGLYTVLVSATSNIKRNSLMMKSFINVYKINSPTRLYIVNIDNTHNKRNFYRGGIKNAQTMKFLIMFILFLQITVNISSFECLFGTYHLTFEGDEGGGV